MISDSKKSRIKSHPNISNSAGPAVLWSNAFLFERYPTQDKVIEKEPEKDPELG